MLEQLRMINKTLIKKYKDNPEKQIRQKLIETLLLNDNCFYNITIEDAYNIFNDLELEEKDYDKIYIILMKDNNYR